MREEDFNKLKANQYFLVLELEARGVLVSAIDVDNELLEARLGHHRELLLNIDSTLSSYAASIVSGEKQTAKKLLRAAGVSVPRGGVFQSHKAQDAAAFARRLGFPVVVKPVTGCQGDDVFTGIEYDSELAEIFESILKRQGTIRLIVEEHFKGNEYRIFITSEGQYAAILRDPAYVIGDGRQTIAGLVDAENYKRTHPRVNCLCPILLDEISAKFLRKQGMNFDYVPGQGEKVYVRGNSNVKCGAMAEDVTDIVHPSVIDICSRALRAFPGLAYAGIDFMCDDIRMPQQKDSYRVIEVNSLPGIGMHLSPGRGKPRNVSAMIVDMMFPETSAVRNAA